MKKERYEAAVRAYMEVLLAPKESDESGYAQPPAGMPDKKWAKFLRETWPKYCRVKLEDTRFYTEKRNWCNENAHFYYVAHNEKIWHFMDRETAVLFKLTFGGIVE